MDDSMTISGERIKALREAKAWSQAHLAEAASLSLRTIQRVEAEGTASAETRLAIAAALDVSVQVLAAPAAPPSAVGERSGPHLDFGPVNTPLMFAASAVALLVAMGLGDRLPAEVASHFDFSGKADGHMSRNAFVAGMCLMMAVLPVQLWLLLGWAMTRRRVNIPNADYWFAQARRAETVRCLHTFSTWLCIGLMVFSGYVAWLVVSANAVSPAHPVMDPTLFRLGLGVFLALCTAGIALLGFRFRRVAP